MREPLCPEPLCPAFAAGCAWICRWPVMDPTGMGRVEGRACVEWTKCQVKVKGMVRLGLLVGASAGFRDQLRLRGC